MAIYHCSLRIFSRSQGHSAVAAAAYRSGSILMDERAGRLHRYDKRSGVAETFILLPKNTSPDLSDRAVLWNAAEFSEKRKNSCVARELILALPHELSASDRHSLTHDMASWLKERYRVAVDAAIHIPVGGDDARNHHAHLLFTTREVTKHGMGKKTRILDDKVAGKQETEVIREVWETLANDALSRAGYSDIKIDRRTLEDQGIDRIPGTHIGPQAQKMAEGASSEDDEGEESGETGKKGSGGGGQAGQASNKDKDEEEGKGDSGSGDPVSLKLQSKPKLDDKGRLINYPAIDQNKTRAAFMAEIKTLNEKRAAFGVKPLKEQIKDIDKLMERLDARLAHMEALADKTALPARIMVAVEKAVSTASKLIGLREHAKASFKLSEKETHARKQRQQGRYGKSYRRGLHSQISEMKSNIQTLQTKQEQYARYSAFVEKLEQEIVKHVPAITPEVKKEPAKPVPKTTNAESSLKLQLKASVMRESLPLAENQAQVKRPEQEQTSSPSQKPVTSTELTASEKEPINLKETARAVFEPPKPTQTKPTFERAHRAFNSEAEKQEAIRREQEDYKTKNTVVFKALEQERVKRQPIQVERVPAQEHYRQPIKLEVKALKAEADRRGPNFVNTQEQINAKRAAAKTATTGKFNKPEDSRPKQARTEDVISRAKERATEARERVPPKYRAEPYDKTEEPKTEKPKTEASSTFSQASTAPNQPRAERPRMSNNFNIESGAQDSSQEQLQRNIDDKPEADI